MGEKEKKARIMLYGMIQGIIFEAMKFGFELRGSIREWSKAKRFVKLEAKKSLERVKKKFGDS